MGIVNRLISIQRVLLNFWKKDYLWLNKNKFLRMDANVPLLDKKRRDFHIDRYKFVVDYLKTKTNGSPRILDAACGTGYGSDILKKLNPEHILGLDISPDTINYAKNKYASENCEFRVCNVVEMNDCKIPERDVIVSFETIEHIEAPLKLLDNFKKILKKGGLLFISTPNKWGPTKDHKFDYDYNMFKEHLEKYFIIENIFAQNSGSMELWVNRNCEKRLVKASADNIETAECFIAICSNK